MSAKGNASDGEDSAEEDSREKPVAYKKLDKFSPGQKCSFCHSCLADSLQYGDIYQVEDLICHYFCVLLSSKLVQHGEDHEGILGFLPCDLRKELKRGARVRCFYCKKSGATLGCELKACKKTFHLPCGLKAGSLHMFFGQYPTYCEEHRPSQKVKKEILEWLSKQEDKIICPICYDDITPKVSNDVLWGPCCGRHSWFHRLCIQGLATTAGRHFTKCPVCNNVEDFKREMENFGIYMPDRDAAWETEPDAYSDLLHSHSTCDAESCECPDGRESKRERGSWRLLKCNACGSKGTHIHCARLKVSVPNSCWRCEDCVLTIQGNKSDRREPAGVPSSVTSFNAGDPLPIIAASTSSGTSTSSSISSRASSPISTSRASSSSTSSAERRPADSHEEEQASKKRKACSEDDGIGVNTELVSKVEKKEEPLPDKNTPGGLQEQVIILSDESSDEGDVEVQILDDEENKITLKSLLGYAPKPEHELTTNEGIKIKVHHVSSDKKNSHIGEVGGVRVRESPAGISSQKVCPGKLEMTIGKQVSVFSVSSPTKSCKNQLPTSHNVQITPVKNNESLTKPQLVKVKEVQQVCGSLIKTDTHSSLPRIESIQSLSPQYRQQQSSLASERETSFGCITDVRHTEEFFPSCKSGQEQKTVLNVQSPYLPAVPSTAMQNAPIDVVQKSQTNAQPLNIPQVPLMATHSTSSAVVQQPRLNIQSQNVSGISGTVVSRANMIPTQTAPAMFSPVSVVYVPVVTSTGDYGYQPCYCPIPLEGFPQIPRNPRPDDVDVVVLD